MSVEIYKYEEKGVGNGLPEGSILVQLLNNANADLHALCLFDSGITNSLTNQQFLPPLIQAKIGKMQSFTTTQGYMKVPNIMLEKIFSSLTSVSHKNPRDFFTAI